MRLVGLVSGGKDSVYNLLQCVAAGHEIVAIANMEPVHEEELDSYMYQSVGHEVVSLMARALALPLYRQKTKGNAVCKNKIYVETFNDEVEDLFKLIQKVKNEVHIEGVAVGAIASDYQRTRVENVCGRLNLNCFAYLWRRNQAEVLQEMIDAGVDAIIIKVASIGLKSEHIGMHMAQINHYLLEINRKFGVNVCGEGGEYETLTLDCPLFLRKININDSEKIILTNDAFAPVVYLHVRKAELRENVWGIEDPYEALQARINYIKNVVKSPYFYVQDCFDEITANIFPQNLTNFQHEPLPLPFIEEKKELPLRFTEYWKASSSQQPHSNAISESSASPTTGLDFNYSTGWCCFGNVTGSTLKDAFDCLQKHFRRINCSFHDVVFVNLFMTNMDEYSAINKIYCRFMPQVLPPARVCVATPLPSKVKILMIAVAHRLVSKSQKVIHPTYSSDRDGLHVQSISHWAPANIGPYSQCIKVGEIYYISGQIPLIPGTMEILNKPIIHQCRLALRHVLRVMQAMNENFDYSNVLQAICYVTSQETAKDILHFWSYITKNERPTVVAVVISALPKNAQLEWEVLASGGNEVKVEEEVNTIGDFNLQMKRCVNTDSLSGSLVCHIGYSKKTGKNTETLRNTVDSIIKYSLQFLKKDINSFSTRLCMLKLFYKYDSSISSVFGDIVKSSYDWKVVATAIPVIACQRPDVLFSIVGACH